MMLQNGGAMRLSVAGKKYHPGLVRSRLARELFGGRFRPWQSVKLREIALASAAAKES